MRADPLAALVLLGWVAILLLGLALAGVLRKIHTLEHAALTGRSREIELRGRTLPPDLPPASWLDRRKQTVVLAVREGCRTCEALLSRASEFDADPASGVAFRVLPIGSELRTALSNIPQGDRDWLSRHLGVVATPHVAIVEPSGVLLRNEPIGSEESFVTVINGGAAR